MAQLKRHALTVVMLLAATIFLLPSPAATRPVHGVHMRRLADAKADATSTGGTALSVSHSQGKSDVTTSSTSSNGGTAVAIKSANDDALHIVSSAADGNSSFTYSSSTPHSKGDAWDSAPACRNSSTATFDVSMRLWGWENNAPCAFKEDKAAAASTGPAKADAWDSAPPCKQADTSATKDDSGRLWAWENGASCAFKAPGDGGDAVWEAAKPCAAPATADNVQATDNRGRRWGWQNGASCAFKGTSSRKMLALIHRLIPQPVHGVHVRRLADAKADATSTGGTALSVSDSQGKSDVTTSSTSSNGGTAVAVKSASDDASHIVSSAAGSNSSFTYSSSTPHSKGDAWDSAPACRNSSTATFDASMRLWGWENNAPCAFKEDKAAAASTGPAKADAWDSAPPCKQADTSATKDDSGRLWGWENGASCAFKAPGDGGDAVWEAAKPCTTPATSDFVKATDNRGRKWGWENDASCAFKGTASRKMLGVTNALNPPAGQVTVSTISYGDDVECTYAAAGTSSSVQCKKKTPLPVPANTARNTASAVPTTAKNRLPASPELGLQPASNSVNANPANAAVQLAQLADLAAHTASNGARQAVDPPAANALPAEDLPAEEQPSNSVTNANLVNAITSTDYYTEDEPAVDTASNSNSNASPAANTASTNAPAPLPAANTAVQGASVTAADPANNSSISPATPAAVDDATDVPVPGGDYNVAHSGAGYIVGGVKGRTDTFGKPVTGEISSAEDTTTSPPAGAISASTSPTTPEDSTVASPEAAASPAPPAAAPPSPAPATSSEPTWETAPVCVGLPTKQTSVQDLSGRLWWVIPSGSNWASCAYRAADGTAVYFEGYQQVQFDSSPACEHAPSITNAMSDSSGRLWGWKEGQAGESVNCRFLKADGTPVMKAEVFTVQT